MPKIPLYGILGGPQINECRLNAHTFYDAD